MTRPPSAPARRNRQQSLAEMMRSLLLFMLDSGMTRAELGALLDSALSHAYARRADAARMREHSATVSGVLFAWHREPLCLDASARPRPLPLRGRQASVEALARVHCSAREIAAVLEALRAQRLIRPAGRGRWLPSGPVATFREYSPQLSGYVGEAILNLMNTIQANLATAARERGPHSQPLIERAALVRDLPRGLAAEFRSHVQEQGSAFLANIDDWLEAHRAAGAPRRAVGARGVRHAALTPAEAAGLTAGVHVFAFLGDASGRRRAARP
jgi:hypothetical protein